MNMYRFLAIPEPKFKVGELVVLTRSTPLIRLESSCGEIKLFPNGSEDRDYLFQIAKREYKKCNGDKNRKWYYSGVEFEYKPKKSISLIQVPVFSTGHYNASENKLRKLEAILVKGN